MTSTGHTGCQLDEKRARKIRARLAEFPLDDVLDAVRGWDRDPWEGRRGQNELVILLRDAGQVEKFRDLWRKPAVVVTLPPGDQDRARAFDERWNAMVAKGRAPTRARANRRDRSRDDPPASRRLRAIGQEDRAARHAELAVFARGHHVRDLQQRHAKIEAIGPWEAKAFEMLSRGYDPGHLALAFMEQFVANSYGEPERGITNASSVDKLSETDPPM